MYLLRYRLPVPLLCLLLLLWTLPAAAAERVALVIGNGAYQHTATLANPANDSRAVAGALRELGFTVYDGIDLTRSQMEALIGHFAKDAQGAAVGLLFYAGHGLQVAGKNYLVPVDAELGDEADLAFQTVPLDLALAQLERTAATRLILLDACRDNPLARDLRQSMGATRSAAIGQGLAPLSTGLGTLIAYATQPDAVALDGADGNSPFTAALIQHIATPNLEIRQMLTRVRRDVIAVTDGRQVPWDHSSLTGDFFFQTGGEAVADTPTPSPATIPVQQETVASVRGGASEQIEAQKAAAAAAAAPAAAVAAATLDAPEEATAGSEITVNWTGPDEQGDYLTVVAPTVPDGQYGNYVYTAQGNPSPLLLPDKGGQYELRYVSEQRKTVLARRPIRLTPAVASLDAPSEASAGSTLAVRWSGPNNKGDYLTVVTPDAPDNQYGSYSYTAQGNPGTLLMPDQEGLFELRYVTGQSFIVLARSPIVLSVVTAQLTALDSVPVAEPMQVDWEGPGNQGDYITVVTVNTPDDQFGAYAYTAQGTPARFNAPKQAGAYELRYVSGQSGRVLARRPLEVATAEELAKRLDTAAAVTVILRAVDTSGQPVAGANWTVYNLLGKPELRRASGDVAQLALPPGRYRANASGNGMSRSLDFLVNAGTTPTHELVLGQ